jgi:hypothetical protein
VGELLQGCVRGKGPVPVYLSWRNRAARVPRPQIATSIICRSTSAEFLVKYGQKRREPC